MGGVLWAGGKKSERNREIFLSWFGTGTDSCSSWNRSELGEDRWPMRQGKRRKKKQDRTWGERKERAGSVVLHGLLRSFLFSSFISVFFC